MVGYGSVLLSLLSIARVHYFDVSWFGRFYGEVCGAVRRTYAVDTGAGVVILRVGRIVCANVFLLLTIVLTVMLFFVFKSNRGGDTSTSTGDLCGPKVCASSVSLGRGAFSLRMAISSSEMASVHLMGLDRDATTVFPLVRPTLRSLTDRVCASRSLRGVRCSRSRGCASVVLLGTVRATLGGTRGG